MAGGLVLDFSGLAGLGWLLFGERVVLSAGFCCLCCDCLFAVCLILFRFGLVVIWWSW